MPRRWRLGSVDCGGRCGGGVRAVGRGGVGDEANVVGAGGTDRGGGAEVGEAAVVEVVGEAELQVGGAGLGESLGGAVGDGAAVCGVRLAAVGEDLAVEVEVTESEDDGLNADLAGLVGGYRDREAG